MVPEQVLWGPQNILLPHLVYTDIYELLLANFHTAPHSMIPHELKWP